MSLLDEAEQKSDLQLLTQMDRQPGSPSPLWASTHCKDLLHHTSKNNFRVRQLLGCHGLETDATRFRVRKGGLRVGSSTCRLCDQGDEDPTHFLATCPALAGRRAELLQAIPLALHVVVPDPAREPVEFTSTLLGVPWIDDTEFQEFAISFITELKALRADILLNHPQVGGTLLKRRQERKKDQSPYMPSLYRILVVTVLKWQNVPLLNKKSCRCSEWNGFGNYQVHTRTFFF